MVNGSGGVNPFGRLNSQSLAASSGSSSASSSSGSTDEVLFTYSSDLKFTDAFQFAEGHIADNDSNQDGSLDKLELSQNIFGGDDEQAAQFLKVVDQNQDKKIDALENAAYVMYQDDSSNLLSGTIKAFADQIENPLMKDLLNLAADVLTQLFPSNLDGSVTENEALLAEASVMQLGTQASETLNGIINTPVEDRNGKEMTLAERYQEYQSEKSG